MKPVFTTVSALVASLCFAGAVGAQTTQTAPDKGARTPATDTAAKDAARSVARADKDFLEKAAHAGHAEVEASKLAQQKASHADVKTFAAQMVTDHTKAGEELAKLAAAKGVKVPTEPTLTDKAKLKMLAAADGEKFDKRYAENFGVKAHEDTIKLFQNAAQKAQDAEIKSFAEKTLPKLQHHLTMAQSMHAAVDPPAAGNKATQRADKAAKERAEKSEKKQP